MTSSLFNDFSFTLLARLSVLSLSSRSPREDGFGYRSIEEREKKRSLKSWQTVVASSYSFSSSCFIFSISFSLMRLVFTFHSLSECYFLYDASKREVKNDFPTRPSFFSPDRRFVLMSSSSFTCSNSVRNYLVSFSLSSSNHNSLYVHFSEQIESHRQEKEKQKQERGRER
jgi:hypothetical protein